MKLTIRWNSEEEGIAVFKSFGKEFCRFELYAVDEDEAELSFCASGQCTEINEKIILKMTKVLKQLRGIAERGISSVLFSTKPEEFSGRLFSEIEHSTCVVEKVYSEYMLKKVPKTAENGGFEGTKTPQGKESGTPEIKKQPGQNLSILQLENEIRCVWNGEEDLFSCKLKPYRDGYYIYEVMVREEMRNQGIGTRAMEELLHRAEVPGTMYLQVGSYNERAVHLYRKLGFETETELCYYRLNEE